MSACRSVTIALHAAIVLLAGHAYAASPAQRHIIWGVNGHPLVSYPGVSIETQLDAVRELGMTSYRVDIGSIEHIPGLQRLVHEARARGITVLPVITGGFDLDKNPPELIEKKAFGVAFALVSSFRGQIPVWELGNELENYAIIQPCEMQDDGKQYSCSYGPTGGRGPLEYYGPRWAKVSAALKGMTEGARAADPSVRRAVGTAGWGHLGAFERMRADGIEWDISVWHMYGQNPEWAFKELVKYQRPIWVTEFNHPEGSKEGKEAQAQGLTRAISQLSDLQEAYGVEAAHIYELMDEPYWEGFEAHMGLIELKKDENGGWTVGARKPAYDAVKAHLALGDAAQAQPILVRSKCELTPQAVGDTVEAQAIISYAYCLTLGRAPDGGGADSWRKRLGGGMSVEQLLVELMHGTEFADLYDLPVLTKAEHVMLIYRLLLGTDPSTQALKKAVSDLNADKKPVDLQRALIRSKEFQARHPGLLTKSAPIKQAEAGGERAKPLVRRSCDLSVMRRPLEFQRGPLIYSYCLVLGRWPDGYGLRTWLAEMRAGLALKNVLLRLLQSDEFAGRYQIAAMTNADFVTLLYRLLLGRDPDAAGLESYVSKLATGALSRTQVCEDVLNSDEFHAKREVLFTALEPERPRAERQPN